RDVAGSHGRGTNDCRDLRRLSVFANRSLFRDESPGSFSDRSRGDGASRRILESNAADDHGSRRRRKGEYMSHSFTRRKFITGAIAASAAATASGAAAVLARRYGLVPPDHGGLFGAGETLTYAAHRVLLYRQPLAREFRRDQISQNFPAINTTFP